MKRILALLLCFATVFSLFACGAEENKTETLEEVKTEASSSNKEEAKTEDKKEETENNNHVVNDKSTKQKLAAIPIANSAMSEMELRQICVDFMRLQVTFTWMPNKKMNHDKLVVDRVPGTLFGGLPYISAASGNLYRAMEYYDEETGIIDMTAFADNGDYFGNACSGSAFWGWFRVVNSMDTSAGAWTNNCTHLNGCLRVGPYTYKDVQNFHEVKSDSTAKYTAQNAVEENTEQIMYQSYAATKIADGVVHPGHVRMVTVAPTVVYNEDGTINGDESWLGCTEQVKFVNDASQDHDRVQEDGTAYHIQGCCDMKYTFKQLYEKYYIPFTFAEFLGTDPVEPAQINFSVTSTSVTPDELQAATFSANYAISDFFISVTDAEGKEVMNIPRRMSAHYFRSITDMTKSVFVPGIITSLKNYAAKGGHTVSVAVQLSNGEKITFYTGTLVG